MKVCVIEVADKQILNRTISGNGQNPVNTAELYRLKEDLAREQENSKQLTACLEEMLHDVVNMQESNELAEMKRADMDEMQRKEIQSLIEQKHEIEKDYEEKISVLLRQLNSTGERNSEVGQNVPN